MIDYKTQPINSDEFALLANEYITSMTVYVNAAKMLLRIAFVKGNIYYSDNKDYGEILNH